MKREPSNKGMKQTSVEHTERSQLIPGVGRTMRAWKKPMRELAVSAVALVLLASPSAFACSCMAEEPAAEALVAADAVFRGTVLAVEPAESRYAAAARRAWCTVKGWAGGEDADTCDIQAHIKRNWETFGFIATFRVQATWKGSDATTMRVRSNPFGGGSCGVAWQVGDEWVIYAYGSRLLYTDGCSRSRFGAAAASEAKALGKPLGERP
jgi:hypothetical protein